MEAVHAAWQIPTPRQYPTFYVKCISHVTRPDGSTRVSFIGTSREMTSAVATATWPAALAIEAIQQHGVRFRCPDRQAVVYVDLVTGHDAEGPFLKAVVDRDEPLTLLTLRNRDLETETKLVLRVLDVLE